MSLPTTLKSSALALFVLLAVAAPEAPPVRSDYASLRGQLLVASRTMGDPRFYHAVILMVRDNRQGSMGIIINHPVGERSLAQILAAVGDKNSGVKGDIPVFAGGPVQPELGFVLHSTDYARPTTLKVDATVSMTADRQILIDIAHKKGPKKSLFAFGYAGWGPGQLQQEMARHDWYTAEDDPKLLFDLDRGQVWDEAMARRLRSL
jgi:putative transcriptional regulator